jgi:ribonuclease J
VGAVAHLWPQLRCPIHAGPFVSAVLRRKLGEAGLLGQVEIVTHAPGSRWTVGKYDLEFLRVAHSVPEAQALAIRTPYGTVMHTGDWKLDPNPLIGPPTDEAAFARLGEEGVLAMVCDSTNALVEGHSGSEAEVRRNLAAIIKTLKGRVAGHLLLDQPRAHRIGGARGPRRRAGDRAVRPVAAQRGSRGARMRLPARPAALPDEEQAGEVSDDRLVVVCTGSQGEPRSAMAKIAGDTHPNISLGEGDTVIFSSRMIPGNERAILRIQDELSRAGVEVMTAEDHMVHVSGHPARDELKRLYQLVKPKYCVPVHGEWRHMNEHANLAESLGAIAYVIEDGDVLRLRPRHAGHRGGRAGRPPRGGWAAAAAARWRRAGGAEEDAGERHRRRIARGGRVRAGARPAADRRPRPVRRDG